MSRSEVAQIIKQIEVEFEAGMQALHGLALGTAQHAFITTRMENIGGLHEQLRALVGDAAMPLIVESLDHLHHDQDNP